MFHEFSNRKMKKTKWEFWRWIIINGYIFQSFLTVLTVFSNNIARKDDFVRGAGVIYDLGRWQVFRWSIEYDRATAHYKHDFVVPYEPQRPSETVASTKR